jgi:ATP-binding cassette subfamily B (MDR/TAP) protein 1
MTFDFQHELCFADCLTFGAFTTLTHDHAMSALSSTSNSADERDKSNSTEDGEDLIHEMGRKALFSFTTRKHIPVLAIAVTAGIVAALCLPAMAIVFGLIFRQFSDFGAGKLTGTVFLRNVSKYCMYLVAFGSISWLANSIYFMCFLTFGELQAHSARDQIFNALLLKNMAWYDTRDTGVAAFLSDIQM